MDLSIKKLRASEPLESAEQRALIKWSNQFPELKWLHAIPNGGKRGQREATNLKLEGVKRGISDLFLPLKKGSYSGLYIEMKRRGGGKASPEQLEFFEFASGQGFKTALCHGFIEAKKVILDYLAL